MAKSLADMSFADMEKEFGVGETPASNLGGNFSVAAPQQAVAPTSIQTSVQQPAAPNDWLNMTDDDLAATVGVPKETIEKLTDPMTGEVRPVYANGLEPDTAINKSPISIGDRFKLGFGNEAGKVAYLKEKFEQVSQDKNGNLVVMDKGIWHRVDASGLGDGDAWDKTKELFKDMADMGDVVNESAGIEGGMYGGALTGAKAGLAVGGIGGAVVGAVIGFVGGTAGGLALAKKLNTSMGRYFGTYEDSPENEMQNLSIETALNVAGAYLPAGVRVTARTFGKALQKAAPGLSKMSGATKAVVSAALGPISGAGMDNYRYLLDNAEKVGAVMSTYGYGKQGAQAMKQKAVEYTADLANSTRGALTKMYSSGLEDVISTMPKNVVAPIKEVVTDMQQNLVTSGFAVLDKSGNLVLKKADDILKMQQVGGDVTEFGTNPAVYKMLQNFTKELNAYSKMSAKSGKEGARQIVDLEKRIGDLAGRYKEEAFENRFVAAKIFFENLEKGLDSSIDAQMVKKLGGPEFSQSYNTLRRNYRETKKSVQPILDAQRTAMRKGSMEAYETLYNKLTAAGSGQAVTKNAAIKAVAKLGANNPAIKQLVDNIELYSITQRFTPQVREGMLGFATAGGAGSLVATGDPTMLIGAASMGAITSPMITSKVGTMAMNSKQAVVKSLREFSNFIRTLPPKQLQQLATDPDNFRRLLITTLQASNMAEEVDQLLQGTGIQPQGR